MGRLQRRIFAIEVDTIDFISGQEEGVKGQVTFGERHPGEIGKDILAVKTALGLLVGTLDINNNSPTEDSLGVGWFDCETGRVISAREGATFDDKMKAALMTFQVENQYLMLSYVFNKFSIRNLLNVKQKSRDRGDQFYSTGDDEEDHSYRTKKQARLLNLLRELEAIQTLFAAEYGILGEATLAVLHGWRPNTLFENTSYFYGENPGLIEAVPIELYNMVAGGSIRSPITARMLHGEDGFNDHVRADGVDYLENMNSDMRNWLKEAKKHDSMKFGYIKWAHRPDNFESKLYLGAKDVISNMDDGDDEDPDAPRSTARNRLVERAFEPNPHTDPTPYQINLVKIGFFDRTEFSFSSLPNDDEETIKRLEDKALVKILRFYNKPDVWKLHKQDPTFLSDYYALDTEFPSPTRIQRTGQPDGGVSKDYWLLSTNDLASSLIPRNLEHYSVIEGFNNREPLIKFVEYRTPTLRPGDVYRAYFEINRKKLDSIEEGFYIEELIPPETESDQSEASPAESALERERQAIADTYCLDGSDLDSEEARVQYEKYRSFAAKEKKEIIRNLRAQQLTASQQSAMRGSGLQADLGVFGNVSLTDEDWSAFGALQGISNLIPSDRNAARSGNDKDRGPNDLKMGYTFLKQATEKGAENLREAGSKSSDVEFDPEFDANIEAELVEQIVPALVQFASKGPLEKARKAGTPTKSMVDYLKGADDYRWNPTKTEQDIHFKFGSSEPPDEPGKTLLKISFNGGDIYDASNAKGIPGPELAPEIFKRPRTMNYLANIEDMSGVYSHGGKGNAGGLSSLIDSKNSTCGDAIQNLAGNAGASYATKYTRGLTVKSDSKKWYKPFSDWGNEKVAEPWKKYINARDADAGGRLFSAVKPQFGMDEMLPLIGEACTLDQLYKEFLEKYNLWSLLCNYLKCLKLPPISLSLPNFNIPNIPKIPTFDFMGFFTQKMIDLIISILQRALCALVRGIMDILTWPVCEDNLFDDMYGAGSPNTSPLAQKALVDALMDIGIPKDADIMAKASDLIDEVVKVLTPREFCALLQGKPVSDEIYNVLHRLIQKQPGLGESLNTKDKIKFFFESVGIYADPALCQELEKYNELVGTYVCKETADVLTQIRNRLRKNENITDEEIQEALDLAEKNLTDKAKGVETMMSEGLGDMIPDFLNLGSDNAIISELPDSVSNSAETMAKNVFEMAKISYISALRSFGSSLYLNIPGTTEPGERDHPWLPTLKVEEAVEHLRLYSDVISQPDYDSSEMIDLARSLEVMYTEFETIDEDLDGDGELEKYHVKIDLQDLPPDERSTNSANY